MNKVREAVQANLRKQRGGKLTWTAAVDADMAAVLVKVQQLANDPGAPDQRAPNVRELMNALQVLRQTTTRLAAVADDVEAEQLAKFSA